MFAKISRPFAVALVAILRGIWVLSGMVAVPALLLLQIPIFGICLLIAWVTKDISEGIAELWDIEPL